MGDGLVACGGYPLSLSGSELTERDARARAVVEAHFVFVWRLLRRLGVAKSDADDAAQQVFIVAARSLERIAESSERSFLFGCALRTASTYRRDQRRRREVDDASLAECPDGQLPADEAVAQRQGLALLDGMIGAMPSELRVVFVLCEIEELSVPEAAALEGIPVGTAASRLRRARKLFEASVQRTVKGARQP